MHPRFGFLLTRLASITIATILTTTAASAQTRVPIRAGETVTGTFRSSSSGDHIYVFRGQGTLLTLTFRTTGFVGRLRLRSGPSDSLMASQGMDIWTVQTGPGRELKQALALFDPEEKAHHIVIRSPYIGEAGTYTLTVEESVPKQQGSLRPGRSASGSLEFGPGPRLPGEMMPFHIWRVDGVAGQSLSAAVSPAEEVELIWGILVDGLFVGITDEPTVTVNTNGTYGLLVSPKNYLAGRSPIVTEQRGHPAVRYNISLTEAQAVAPSAPDVPESAVPLQPGVLVRDEIPASEPVNTSGERYREYTFRAQAGDEITMQLRADAIASLQLGRVQDGKFAAHFTHGNRGSADRRLAEIVNVAPEGGEYIARVATNGAYELMLQLQRAPTPQIAGTIRLGTEVRTALNPRAVADRHVADVWLVQLPDTAIIQATAKATGFRPTLQLGRIQNGQFVGIRNAAPGYLSADTQYAHGGISGHKAGEYAVRISGSALGADAAGEYSLKLALIEQSAADAFDPWAEFVGSGSGQASTDPVVMDPVVLDLQFGPAGSDRIEPVNISDCRFQYSASGLEIIGLTGKNTCSADAFAGVDGNFRVDTRARVIQSTGDLAHGVGIVIPGYGYPKDFMELVLLIRGPQFSLVAYDYQQAGFEFVIPWTNSPALRTGVNALNQLTVSSHGMRLDLQANDQHLGSYVYPADVMLTKVRLRLDGGSSTLPMSVAFPSVRVQQIQR